MWPFLSFLCPCFILKGSKTLEHQCPAKEILEFLFGHEITLAQRQKALDAAVAEDLNRGDENGFSFQGQQAENHTSDMDLDSKKTDFTRWFLDILWVLICF